MVATPAVRPTRRIVAIGLGAALLTPNAFAKAGRPKVITILGDSITAGLGLPAADALPAQLGASLEQLGVTAVVRGAGVSGDTTADGLARIGFSVQSDTDLCIVELGGTDLLQGVDPKLTRASLLGIVQKLKARHIPVLMTGLLAPPMIGAAYARDYDAAFTGVAKAERVPLYPFLLEGVAGNPALLQADHIHPNPAGVKIIAAKLAPFVAKTLK